MLYNQILSLVFYFFQMCFQQPYIYYPLLKYIYNFYQHVELFISEKEDKSLEVKFIIPHYSKFSSSFEEELNTFDDYSISIIKNEETMIIQYIYSLSSYH